MTVYLGLMCARYSSKHFEVFNYLLYKQITETERGIQVLMSNFIFFKTFPLILLISYHCLNLSLILSLPFNNTAICLSPSIATLAGWGGCSLFSFILVFLEPGINPNRQNIINKCKAGA